MDNLSTRRSVSMTPGGQGGTRSGTNRVVRWAGMVMVLVSVLAVAVKVAFALTYAGPVTVTANMGSFSPNPVQINNAVTANLSANYYPPSGVPEGDLSAQYNWSVSQVQYKALQADTYGSPPADSYTDSISPTQPSASSGATLTFTPLIAGYWAVSVSCGVTVTDTQTSQYWSGSGNAGPQDLTSVELTITPKDGTTVFVNTKNFVHVTFAPSDLQAELNITGGATFVGGVTSQAMTSASEDVYFYGPNIYSSGGPSSGEISVTLSPPPTQSATNGTLATAKPNAVAAASGGFTYKATIPVQTLLTSDPVIATCKILDQSMVSSGTGFIASYVKPSTDSSLLGIYANYSLPQAQRDGAFAMYNELNNGGYNDLQNASNTLFEDLTTGVDLASVPPSINPLNLGVLPSLAAAVQGFPASSIQNVSFTPSWILNLGYPVISPTGQWTPPKLGDLVSNFSVDAKGPISFGDFANGYWTCSAAVGLVPNHDFQLQSGIFTLQGGWYVHPWNDPNAYTGFTANLQYSFPEGSAKNFSAGVGLVAEIKF